MKVFALVFLALLGTSQAGIGCEVCEGLIGFVDTLLQNDEQTIENDAMGYCDKLGFLSSICKNLVQQYLPQIVADLKNGDDQQTICNAIGNFCSEKKALPSFGAECMICEEILKVIAALGGNEEPTIENVVDKVCDKLGLFKQPCIELVKDYLPKIISALANPETEDRACSAVGLCSSQKVVMKAAAKKQPKGLECSFCEALIGFIDTLLQDNEGDIQQKVDSYCQDLPILQSTCQDLVNKYLNVIIQDLKNGQDQEDICNEIGNFCSAQSKLAVQKAFMAHVKGQTKDVKCDICEELCKWIEDYGVNKGIDAIKSYVDGKCDDLPFVSSVCKDLVNDLLDKIVPLLQQNLPPEKVCQDVDLC